MKAALRPAPLLDVQQRHSHRPARDRRRSLLRACCDAAAKTVRPDFTGPGRRPHPRRRPQLEVDKAELTSCGARTQGPRPARVDGAP